MNYKYFKTLMGLMIILFNIAPLALNRANAQESPGIVINEIAWMGSLPQNSETTSQAANDEWIELFNQADTSINVTGWTLASQDGNPSISLSGSIPANGYFLLSRSNDAVSGIEADIVYEYKGNALSNSGEYLKLANADGTVIHEINASSGWPAGDNSTKETMQLTTANAWINGPVGGTPKEENSNNDGHSEPVEESPEISTVADTQDSSAEPQNDEENDGEGPAPGYTSGKGQEEPPKENTVNSGKNETESQDDAFIKTKDIIISEFLPNPEGKDSGLEWIEIFNSGTEAHNLSAWMLDDEDGGSNPYAFPEETAISPNSYLVLSIQTTGIQLNNGEDAVRLLYPDNSAADEVYYSDKAKEGYAYALVNNQWAWTDTPTPGSGNIMHLKKGSQEKAAQSAVINKKKEIPAKEQKTARHIDNAITDANNLSADIQRSSGPSPLIPVLAVSSVSALAGISYVFFRKKYANKKPPA